VSAPARLALFAATLAAVFGASFALGGATDEEDPAVTVTTTTVAAATDHGGHAVPAGP
jgi:hypothetical protein